MGDLFRRSLLDGPGHARGLKDTGCPGRLTGPRFNSRITKPLYDKARSAD
ncbi:hypothetical protein ACFV2H_37740 [Streptomyces sp. NPDC059629]